MSVKCTVGIFIYKKMINKKNKNDKYSMEKNDVLNDG